MIAQFNGFCRDCGDGVHQGDEAHYAEGVLTCMDCGPWTPGESTGAATGLEDAPGYVRKLAERIERNESRIASLQMTVGKQQQEIDGLRAWACGLSTELGIPAPVVGA